MIKRNPRWAAPFCLVLLLLLANSLVGCTSVPPRTFDSPVPAATDAVAPEVPSQSSPAATLATSADKGAIVGTVSNRTGALPADTKVFVARFIWNDAKTVGVFYLDTGSVLSVPIEASGAFQVPDLEPGDYVLVIGVTPENAMPIMGNDNQARVIAVQAGQSVDLGEQTMDLQSNPQ
jgi:hypothetical protein